MRIWAVHAAVFLSLFGTAFILALFHRFMVKDNSFRSWPWLGFLLALLSCGLPTAEAAEAWTSFHNGGNTSIGAQNLPITWSPEAGVAWSARLPGYGQSAPVVWGDQVFLTAIDGDQKETCIVAAFHVADGRRLWTKTFPAAVKKENSYMVSRATPTPLVDADGLYVLFESGDLVALSHTGEKRWHQELFDDGERAFQNGHGYGASPAQTAESIIVLVDHRGPSYLAAISKQSGEELWKVERSSRPSWTSPVVTSVDGRDQVVVSSGGTVDGYDAGTGKQLWNFDQVSGNIIPSATVVGDRVFVGASESRRGTDADEAAKSNCCLQITNDGCQLLWQADKAVCHYVSPLVHRGYVYYVNKLGVLRCIDAQSGEQHYEVRMGEPCWAQPIASGDRLYFFGKRGITKVVTAGPDYELLAENRLWPEDAPPLPGRGYDYTPESEDDPRPAKPTDEYLDPLVYGVAAVDNAFFVRVGTHLYCVRQTATAE